MPNTASGSFLLMMQSGVEDTCFSREPQHFPELELGAQLGPKRKLGQTRTGCSGRGEQGWLWLKSCSGGLFKHTLAPTQAVLKVGRMILPLTQV